MNANFTDQELHRLFVAKADDSITPEDHEKLSAILKESAEARAQWFAFQDAEAGLLAWAQREASRRSEPVEVMAEVGKHRVTSGGWGKLRYIAALAAGVVIGAVTWAVWPEATETAALGNPGVVGRGEATTSSVAVLSRGVNMEWDEAFAVPAVNAPLSPGLLRLKSGVAEIEFFQGARLCVEGPAEIKLVSAGEAFCQYGRFSAHVPPQAKGFRVGTPKGDVVDLGTDFGLDLRGDKPELHVFKGEVELHRPQTPMQKISGGNAALLGQPADATPLEANASAFDFSRELDALISASQGQAFEKWKSAGVMWNDDPDLRLRFDFQEGEGARSLHNVATHGQEIAAGSVVGCTWTEGRWPGKHALQFRSLSDRVRVSLPGEYKQVTAAAWVQLHSLNIRQSSLCMSQGLASGYMHWQILHDGSLCLGVGVQSNPIVWADYISPVVFTPERFGQWVHLAVVYDLPGGEVRFYANGLRISRHPIQKPMVLTPAIVEIGNWTPSLEKRQQPVRNFVGCMDDFSLVARALKDDDIRALAQ